MGFGKVIRNPVKLIRRKIKTAIATESHLSKQLYKDCVETTSIGSEEELVAAATIATTSTTAIAKEKSGIFIDYGYEDASPAPNRSLACSERAMRTCSERAMRTSRRSSLKSSGSTLRRRASISYRGEVDFILPNGEHGKKRTSITFEETENQTKEVESMLDMVDSPNRLWFQKEEYANIKQEIVRIIKNNHQNKNISPGGGLEEDASSSSSATSSNAASDPPLTPTALECTRGLEPILCESAKEAREQANTSVLEEYSMQQNRGEYNGDALRQIYSYYTIDSQVEAADRADRDEQEVQSYLKDARNMWRRSSC